MSWLGQRRNCRKLKNEFPVRDSDKGDEKGRQDHASGQDFDHVFEEHESRAEEIEGHGKVTLLRDRGEVVSAGLLRVHGADGAVQEVAGDRGIIATGSSALNIPSLPVEHRHIISSDDALEMQSVPGRMLVVGGGLHLARGGHGGADRGPGAGAGLHRDLPAEQLP